jgi:hypothetical protein
VVPLSLHRGKLGGWRGPRPGGHEGADARAYVGDATDDDPTRHHDGGDAGEGADAGAALADAERYSGAASDGGDDAAEDLPNGEAAPRLGGALGEEVCGVGGLLASAAEGDEAECRGLLLKPFLRSYFGGGSVSVE